MRRAAALVLIGLVSILLIVGFSNCGGVTLLNSKSLTSGSTGTLIDDNPPIITYPYCGEVLPNFNWQNADEFQTASGKTSSPVAAAFDSQNNMYVVGSAEIVAPGGGGDNAWIVRKFTAGTQQWSIKDSYLLDSSYGMDSASDIAIDSNDNIYVIGSGYTFWTTFHWIVRKSTDHGDTWTTVDDYRLDSAQNSYANGAHLKIDNVGNILASGLAIGGDNKWHGVVRRLPHGSTTWSTVLDTVRTGNPTNDYMPLPDLITQDAAGTLFIAETWIMNQESARHLVIYKSSDAGLTWQGPLIDFLSYPNYIKYGSGGLYNYGEGGWRLNLSSSTTNLALLGIDTFTCADYNPYNALMDILVSPNGREIWAAGFAQTATATPVNHLIVRYSGNGGFTWNTIDDYTGPNGEGATAMKIISDKNGKVYLIGTRINQGKALWIVRRLLP